MQRERSVGGERQVPVIEPPRRAKAIFKDGEAGHIRLGHQPHPRIISARLTRAAFFDRELAAESFGHGNSLFTN
jgi:hypothetical protein